MKLFDSHCHLQDEKLLARIDDVLARARQAGVQGFCCCGASESDWPAVQDLASRFKDIVPAFGLHPWYVADRTSDWRSALRRHLDSRPDAGVGEIGLDHAIRDRDDKDQVAVFTEQLRIAKELNRFVSIHCRRAWDVMPGLLKEVGTPPAGFVIHSFSGSSEMVKPLAELGAYFSFSGSITFHRNKRGHAAAMAAPLERLLIETDAPDLMPVISPSPRPSPAGGEGADKDKPNEPANIVYVLRKLAGLKGLPEEALAEQVWKNAARIFFQRETVKE